YDAGGLLVESRDRNLRYRNMSYDALNRLAVETWSAPSPNQLTYTYDIANNLLTAASNIDTDSGGGAPLGTYTFTYHARNHRASQQGPYDTWLTNTYDIGSNRIRVDDRIGVTTPVYGVTTSSYDALNRLTSRGFSGISLTQLRMDIKYSPTSQPVTFTRYRSLAGGD